MDALSFHVHVHVHVFFFAYFDFSVLDFSRTGSRRRVGPTFVNLLNLAFSMFALFCLFFCSRVYGRDSVNLVFSEDGPFSEMEEL